MVVSNKDANAEYGALYNAPCAGLSGSECSANQTCRWDNTIKKCIRDPLKFHEHDNVVLKNMTATLSERSDSFTASHHPSRRPDSPTHKQHFIVKELSPNDPLFESLSENHFLKRRKREILADGPDRMQRRNGSMEYYKMRRLNPQKQYTLQQIKEYDKDKAQGDQLAKYAEAEYVDLIKKMPIVFYASEIPVQVISPEQYTGVIGSVSFIPKTNTPHMLYLPELGPGRELLSFDFIGKKNTIELIRYRYSAPDGWSQPPISADYVTYTADEKKSHPTPRTGQYWQELDNELYTILTYAGGSSSGRRSGRRTRNVRKHKIRSRKHKHHKRTQRNRSRPQSRVRK